MDYKTAKAIAEAYKPHLVIDEQNPKIPNALVVRRPVGKDPFSIHIPKHYLQDENTPKLEEDALLLALDAADDILSK